MWTLVMLACRYPWNGTGELDLLEVVDAEDQVLFQDEELRARFYYPTESADPNWTLLLQPSTSEAFTLYFDFESPITTECELQSLLVSVAEPPIILSPAACIDVPTAEWAVSCSHSQDEDDTQHFSISKAATSTGCEDLDGLEFSLTATIDG